MLVHALDRSSPFHSLTWPIYEQFMTERHAWMVADQTLFELYRALRNPSIFARPLSTAEATGVAEKIRDQGAAAHCAYDIRDWPTVMELLQQCSSRKGILVFDAVVAATLKRAGVGTFYTRNIRDFREFGLFDVIDPTADI